MDIKRMDRKKLDSVIWVFLTVAFILFVVFVDKGLSAYPKRILMLGAIYVILAIGLNITFGIGGMFSLGHAGFMAIGGYVTIVLMLSKEAKEKNWYVSPIAPFLKEVEFPFAISLIVGCLVVAIIAIVIGVVVLRLKSDYLGMATLGLAEIIRVFINNMQSLFNGALGLKYLPDIINPYICFGLAAFSVLFAVRLKNTSYGLAITATKDDDTAAEACGIALMWHRVFAFTLGCIMAAAGGALMGLWSATISTKMFTSVQTYTIVLIVVAGGLGNITGTVITSFGVAIMMEWLRFMEEPMTLFNWHYPGIYGMRMLIFAISLLVIIVRFKRGLFGSWEFHPSVFYSKPKFVKKLNNFFSKLRTGEGER